MEVKLTVKQIDDLLYYRKLRLDMSDIDLVISDIYDVGDRLYIHHDVYGDINFIVIGRNHDAEDSITLLSTYIIKIMPYNYLKNTRSLYKQNTEELKGINSNYKDSDIYKFINNEESGLLAGFDKELVDKIITVPKKTYILSDNGDYDIKDVPSKAFLLSASEVGFRILSREPDGEIYELFKKI